jgi:hypothetical protein
VRTRIYQSRRARLRRWLWSAVRRYGYEICYACGRPVDVVWTAPDELWLRIVGGPGGILCVACFDGLCRSEDTYLRWVPEPL